MSGTYFSHWFHRLTTLIIHHPLFLYSRLKTLPFLQILFTVAFFFFFLRTDSTDSLDCLPSISVFTF